MVEPDTSYRKPFLPFRSDKPRSAWRGHLLARNWPAEGAEILPEYPEGAGKPIRPRSRRGLVLVNEPSEHVSTPNTVEGDDDL